MSSKWTWFLTRSSKYSVPSSSRNIWITAFGLCVQSSLQNSEFTFLMVPGVRARRTVTGRLPTTHWDPARPVYHFLNVVQTFTGTHNRAVSYKRFRSMNSCLWELVLHIILQKKQQIHNQETNILTEKPPSISRSPHLYTGVVRTMC